MPEAESAGSRIADAAASLIPAAAGAGQPLSFDHGAQLFLATAPDFQTEVASWAAAGVAQQWRGRHGRITKGVCNLSVQLGSGGRPAASASSCSMQDQLAVSSVLPFCVECFAMSCAPSKG